jgi:hypothetical protein
LRLLNQATHQAGENTIHEEEDRHYALIYSDALSVNGGVLPNPSCNNKGCTEGWNDTCSNSSCQTTNQKNDNCMNTSCSN